MYSETRLHLNTLNDDGSWPLSALTYSEMGHHQANPSLVRSRLLKSEWTEKWVLCQLIENLCLLQWDFFRWNHFFERLSNFSPINELVENGMLMTNDVPALPYYWKDFLKTSWCWSWLFLCWCCRADFINVGSSQFRLNLSFILLLTRSLNKIVHAVKPGPWAGKQKCTVLTIQHNGESQTTFSHCPQGLRSSESWKSKWEITIYKEACTAYRNSVCSNLHLHTLIPAEVSL